MSDVLIVAADARHIPLADNSVQCVVTSPPYWGLRKYAGEQELVWPNGTSTKGIVHCNAGKHKFTGEDVSDVREETTSGKSRTRTTDHFYGDESRKFNGNHQKHSQTHICVLCGAWRGAYGLEPTIEMYVAHTVEVLREVRRVLRLDGVCFWNIGDSYCSGAFSVRTRETPEVGTERRLPRNWYAEANKITRNGNAMASGCKPKDLVLMPHRVALAAQADGWWVRSDIIWAKPNPMPESCKDRPTDSYEHILMLTKAERYFWNFDAVQEPCTGNARTGKVQRRLLV